jgi:hypothetical protein
MKARFLAERNTTRSRILSVLVVLYVSSALIGTRTLYRTVEYFAVANIKYPKPGEAFDPMSISPVVRYEWFFYFFEVVLMLINTLMLNFRHPAKYLPRLISTYLGEDGVERKGCKFKDERNWLYQIFDPFDVVGLVKGNDKRDRWWEKERDEEVEMQTVVAGK